MTELGYAASPDTLLCNAESKIVTERDCDYCGGEDTPVQCSMCGGLGKQYSVVFR